MSPRAPVTEVRDHDLLINLVDGMIRGLNKASDTLRVKATKVEGEIKALAHNKSVEPEEGLSEAAKVDFANVEALTKKAIAEAEIGRASQQEAKEKEFKHINDQLKKIEDRRQTLFRWIRYMRTLDAEATAMRENEATYIQQRQEQLAREAAYFEKEIVDSRSLTKEDFTQIATECQRMLVALEVERKECEEIIHAMEEVKGSLDELHTETEEHLKTIDNRDKEIQQERATITEQLRKAPPGSPQAELLQGILDALQQEQKDNNEIRTEVQKMNKDSSIDGPAVQSLQLRMQKERLDLDAIDKKIALAKELELQAKQAAEMAPSEPSVGTTSPEIPAAVDIRERFLSATAEFHKDHASAAASFTSADQGRRFAAAQFEQHAANFHDITERDRILHQQLKRIAKEQSDLVRRASQLGPMDDAERQRIGLRIKELGRERGELVTRQKELTLMESSAISSTASLSQGFEASSRFSPAFEQRKGQYPPLPDAARNKKFDGAADSRVPDGTTAEEQASTTNSMHDRPKPQPPSSQ